MRAFVGRDRELARLVATAAAGADGDGRIVLVGGPAGVGKSRLVEEALAARDGAVPVGRGYCDPAATDPPLWPWSRAVRSAARRAGDRGDALRALADGILAGGGPARHGEGTPARARLLADAVEALLDAATDVPLLLVLEDLHWADTGTLDLLREVARDLAGTLLVVFGTHRDPPEQALAAFGEFARCDRVETLTVRPLGLTDVRRYLAARPRPPGDGPLTTDAGRVLARCHGLPLLLEAAATTPEVAPAGQVPAEAARFVERALGGLAPAEVAVLQAAALVSPVVDAGLVAVITEEGDARVSWALDAGLRAGLLERTGANGLRFAHALWREAVGDIDPQRGRHLHLRAAEALAEQPDVPGRSARIARHLHAAGPDPRLRHRAAGWSRRAADEARRGLAYPEAAAHMAQAVVALQQADVDPAELAEALVVSAEAEYLAGRYTTAVQRCADAGRAATRVRRTDLVAAAALAVQAVTFPETRHVIRDLAQAALADPDAQVDDVVRARLHAQLALMAADAGEVTDAADHAARAMSLARTASDPRALLEAARAEEITTIEPRQVPRRLELGALVIAQATLLDDPIGAVLGHEWRITAGYLVGRLDIADDDEQRLIEVADRCRLPLARWHVLRVRAARAVLEGRLDEARAANTEADVLALASGDTTAAGMSHVHRMRLAMIRGDLTEVDREHLPMLARVPMPVVQALVGALQLLPGGDRDAARRHYDRVRPLLDEPVRDYRWGGVLAALVPLAEAFADTEGAGLLATHLFPYTRFPGAIGNATAFFSGSIQREYGIALAVAGRPAEARAALAAAIRDDLALGARPDVVFARLDLADLLLRTAPDATAEAAALAREAAAEARRLDMPGPLARAEALVARAGITARINDPLSRRERDVADLLVQALTNREIARRLVLSERTVESHVRSILAKLGCANRTELLLHLTTQP